VTAGKGAENLSLEQQRKIKERRTAIGEAFTKIREERRIAVKVVRR